MEIATFIISMINFIGIVIAGIIYFNNNYEILPKEVYQVLADTHEKTSKEEQASQELVGGCGIAVASGLIIWKMMKRDNKIFILR